MTSSSTERGKTLAWASAAVGVFVLLYLGRSGLNREPPQSLVLVIGRPAAFGALSYFVFRGFPRLRWLLVVWSGVLGLAFFLGFAMAGAPLASEAGVLLTFGLLLIASAATLAFSRDVRAFLESRAAARTGSALPEVRHNEEL